MELDQVGIVTTPEDPIEQGHLELTGQGPPEGNHVVDLLLLEVLLGHRRLHLLDEGELLVGRQGRHLRLELRPPVDDVLSRDKVLEGLHVVLKGDGRLGPHEASRHRVEDGVGGATDLVEVNTGVAEALGEPFPGPLGGDHLARLDLLRRAEVLGVVLDEVRNHRGHTVGPRPGQPVLHRRLEVRNPEPVQEGRVHLVHRVLVTRVDGRDDLGLRVEAHRLAIRTVTQLAVQDDLEHTVEDANQTTVELVQEQDLGLLASRHEPGRRGEGGDARGLDGLEVRVTDHVAFLHGGGADVNQVLALGLRDGGHDLALTDAVRTTDENAHRGGEGVDDRDEGRGFHCVAPTLLFAFRLLVSSNLFPWE